jgi:curli biogenesis system outer membrane secretion channel CsgG
VRYVISTALLGLVVAGAAPAQAQNKATIAVAPFTFHRDYRAAPEAQLETAALTNKLVTALVQSRKFDVVERERIDTLLDEMQLTESGLTDPSRAVEAGRMLGADFFVMGEISVFTATTSVKQVPMTERWIRTREMLLVVDMRIVDTRTSKIVAAERGESRQTSKQRIKGRPSTNVPTTPEEVDVVERDLCQKLVLKVIDAVYPIKVIGVNASGVVSINRGQGGGVAVGDVLDVFTEGEAMVDPDTGEVLGSEETKVGRIRVDQVLAKFSKCSQLAGTAARGNICRPAAGSADFAPPPPPPPPADTSAPRIIVLAPREGAVLNSSPINVVCDVSDDRGVTRVAIAGRDATRDEKGRYRGQVLPNEGGNLVRIEAWDAAGNCGRAEVRFNYDSTPPEVDADATILVEGKVDDLSCTLNINGVSVQYDRSTGQYSVRVPADPSDAGKITIVATDEFGNKTTEVRRVR